MDNIIYIIFMVIIIIISGALKSFFNKASKQRNNRSDNFGNDVQIDDEDEEDTGKKEKSILEELFQDFTIRKESQVYNETSSLKQESNLPIDSEIKKYREPKVDKKTIVDEIKFEQEEKKPEIYSEKTFEDNIKNKESSLDRIKKLNYLGQAIVLSEILGTPKGLDI